MEGIELRKALEESRLFVGARLSKVHQVGEVFFLRFYRPSGALVLDPRGKAFHRTALRPLVPPSPPPFCMRLRSLAGQPLLSLDQAGFDRVVRLRFPQADLILDLRPRQGDLFFVPRDGETVSLRGGHLHAADFVASSDPSVGLGPALRRAAAAHLGRAPREEESASFAASLLDRTPTGFVYDENDRPVASFFPRPDLGEPRLTFPAFWQALDHLLDRRIGADLAHTQLAQVERAIGRRERALAALAAAEAEAKGWPEVQGMADLLLTRIADIPRGASAATVEGFDGQPVTLSLNPALSVAAQATALYAKAKKLRRRLEEIPVRRRALETELRRLRDLQGLLTRQPDLAGYVEDEAQTLTASSPGRATTVPRSRVLTMGGFSVEIGRSARENDRLVRSARACDLWLHARGVPGAHVVIHTDGRPVPREVLQRAAELAAWHSRARGERKVPISYTEARYVRRPRGAAPGMVTLQQEQVIVVPGDKGP